MRKRIKKRHYKGYMSMLKKIPYYGPGNDPFFDEEKSEQNLEDRENYININKINKKVALEYFERQTKLNFKKKYGHIINSIRKRKLDNSTLDK